MDSPHSMTVQRMICWGSAGRSPGLLSAALDGVNDIHSLADGAKHCVIAVEPWGCDGGQEELRATGVSAGVGHGQDSGLVVLEREGRGFARDLPAWTAGACSARHGVF